MQSLQVQVPQGVGPGMQFQVQIGGQVMAIACPQGVGPGAMIQIQVPAATAVVPVAAAPMAHDSDEITKLAGLHSAGVLTDSEFETAKQRILGLAPPGEGGESKYGAVSATPAGPNPATMFQPSWHPAAAGVAVAQSMPVAPPLEGLSDTYTTNPVLEQNFEASDARLPKADVCVSDATHAQAGAAFFAPDELQILRAQPVPVDNYQMGAGGAPLPDGQQLPTATVVGGPPGPGGALPAADVIFTTNAGVPVLKTQNSPAETDLDGSYGRGIKSCDPCLVSFEDIMQFLNTYNTRPKLAVQVWGHHQEQRTRQVSSTDSDGNTSYHTETYYVTVTDFKYNLDLTSFIFPFGYIQVCDLPDLRKRPKRSRSCPHPPACGVLFCRPVWHYLTPLSPALLIASNRTHSPSTRRG